MLDFLIKMFAGAIALGVIAIGLDMMKQHEAAVAVRTLMWIIGFSGFIAGMLDWYVNFRH